MKTGLFSLLFILLLAPFSVAAEQPTAEQIAQLVYDRNLGDDMQMHGKMELISHKGHVRTREFISLRKDNENERKQLIHFTAPADINGTSFLTLEKTGSNDTEQHLYLPALKRSRRIVASQKGRSFVNSDFTYEDMQRHPVAEWNFQLDGEETIAARSCYRLISVPKSGIDTQYSKITSWIDKKNLMPLQTELWNKKGKLAKRYSVTSFEVISQIATETEVVMEDLLSGHKTRLVTKDIIYNSGLKDSLFTKRALEQ